MVAFFHKFFSRICITVAYITTRFSPETLFLKLFHFRLLSAVWRKYHTVYCCTVIV